MPRLAFSRQAKLSAHQHPSELIDFTAGMDFLTPTERARVQRVATRAYRKAERVARRRAEAEGRANLKQKQAEHDALALMVRLAPAVLPATPRSSNDVPQVCAFRLVSLAEAQKNAIIKYHGFI